MFKLKFYQPLLTVLLLTLYSSLLVAQETQIAMDNMSKIYEIDSELEKKLQLFKDYKGFKSAMLFRTSENAAVLEISYQPDQLLLKERKPLNEDELAQFRNDVTYSIRQNAPVSIINQEGGTRFLINNGLLATTFYGLSIPSLAQPIDGKTGLGLYMLTASAGFFVPYIATKNKRITNGAATSSFYGQSRGIIHGATAPLLFTNSPNSRQTLATAMGFSILEGYAGFVWADKAEMSHGKSISTGVFGDFGMGIGLATAHIAGVYDHGNSTVEAKTTALGVLGGSVLGIGAGLISNKNTNYTKGDALVLRSSALLGAIIPTVLLYTTKEEFDINEKYYSLAASIGGISGLAFGQMLAKNNEFTTNQGVFIQLGTLASGAMGLGLTYLTTDNSRAILAGGTVGALFGYGLLVSSYANRRPLKKEEGTSFNFSLNPNALLTFSKQFNSNAITPTFFNASLTF